MKNSKKLVASLKKKLKADGPERGGLILKDKSLMEMENVAQDPSSGFVPNVTLDHLDVLENCVGTWHTHPGQSANLSTEDWEAFSQWPNHVHAIVGTDGVRFYVVEKGAVLNA